MRAVHASQGRVDVVTVAAPEAAADAVLVRVRSAGICGSDLHMLDAGFPTPHTLGHEVAGELADGTPVAIEPLAPCGSCDCCSRGDYNLCRAGPEAVIGVGRDGGMAELLAVPERCLVPLDSRVPVADACLVEPLAIAVHGMRRAERAAGRRVAVVGGGSIGLCAVGVAAARDLEVGLHARHDSQRAAGERLGAKPTRGEYDVVIDCAGTKSALETAASLCRPGGTLLLLASYWDGLELPGFVVCMKELRVVPSSMYGRSGAERDIDVAAALLASRPELAATIITHRLPLDAAEEAFALARDRDRGAIKVVLEP